MNESIMVSHWVSFHKKRSEPHSETKGRCLLACMVCVCVCVCACVCVYVGYPLGKVCHVDFRVALLSLLYVQLLLLLLSQ